MKFVQQSKVTDNITVQKDDIIYTDTSENFEKDMGYAAPILPDWAEDRVYQSGIRHAIHTRDGTRMESGDDPWEDGDKIIEDIELAVESKETRTKEEQDIAFKENEKNRIAWETNQFEKVKQAQIEASATERARPKSKDELKQYAASVRIQKQFGGFTSKNYGLVLTDPNTQSVITGLIVAVGEGMITPPINYKSPSGWITVDGQTLNGVAKEIASFVQACFNKEQQLSGMIDSGSITNQDQIDGAFV